MPERAFGECIHPPRLPVVTRDRASRTGARVLQGACAPSLGLGLLSMLLGSFPDPWESRA